MCTTHVHLSPSSLLSRRRRWARAGALTAILPTFVLLGACVVEPSSDGDDAPLGVAESALCPAPGTPVGFASPEVLFQADVSVPSSPSAGVSADFNSDGLLDAVFVDGNVHRLRFFAGTGAGLALSATSQIASPASSSLPQGATVLDFDGDGDLDIAFATQSGSNLAFAINNGNGVFYAGPTVPIPATYGLRRVAAGDFDGDGRVDVAITANVSRKVQIVLNKASGFVLSPAISTGVVAPFDITAGDFDLDGEIDLAVGVIGGQQPFLVYRGNGDGSFTPVASPAPSGQSVNGASTMGLVFADLDADGLSDAAYVESNTHAVHVFRNTSTPANISFANEIDSGSGPYVLPDILSDIFMTVGDFDVDGRPDLAVLGKAFTVGGRLHVLSNAGAPGAPLAFASAGGPWLVNSNGKTSTTPRGLASGAFNTASCGERSEIVFSSSNTTVADWSVQYVRNTTE